jgi:hypothetical protein
MEIKMMMMMMMMMIFVQRKQRTEKLTTDICHIFLSIPSILTQEILKKGLYNVHKEIKRHKLDLRATINEDKIMSEFHCETTYLFSKFYY